MTQNDADSAVRQGPTVEQLARAAALLYQDELTDEEIARRLGVARRTLARWKRHPLYPPAAAGAAAYGQLLIEQERDARWAVPKAR